MTLKHYITGAVLIVAVALFAYSLFSPAMGGTQVGQEYSSIYLTSTDANSTSTLRLSYGSIGAVVVSEDGTGGGIDFYDMASTTAATSSDDLVFSFDGVALEGTYQYDIGVSTGLLIDVHTGFDGEVVVTYR